MWSLRSIPAADRDRYVADGWWTDEGLGRRLAAGLDRNRHLGFVIHSQARPWAGTFGDVLDAARGVATGFAEKGVGPGDVVSFQLPNWMEAAVTFYAAAMLGAVVVPIVHFYGAREVGYILGASSPQVHVTATGVGPDLAEIGDLAGEVIVLGEQFDGLAASPPLAEPHPVHPDAPALVGWTSGTTSNPKGVIHSHRTIASEVRQLGAAQPPYTRPTLVGAPVGHAIGMLSALLIPVELGRAIHLTDVWDPAAVLRTLLEDDLDSAGGATYFVTSLLDHADFTSAHLGHMSFAGMGGSPVPRAVTDRLTSLGINAFRMYGSTEHPSITGCTYVDPLEKRLATDGRPLPGCAIRLVDEEGRPVETGQPGEILSKGPDCFAGYTDPALTAAAFDAEGWYHTGDIGVLDDDGYLSITDRRSDIIIRGGENISAAEVEELLLRVPGVIEVAVVAAPDVRLGERACAFLRLGAAVPLPDLAAVRRVLAEAGLARQKWPEELVEVTEFPRTASGKVQKFVLRDRLRQRG